MPEEPEGNNKQLHNSNNYGVRFSPAPKNIPNDISKSVGEPSDGQPFEKKRHHDSILTDKDDVFDVTGAFDHGEAGAIITDKKRKKMSFGSTLVAAFSEWTQGAKKKTKNIPLLKKKESPKIASPKTRRDVIQKASEKTARAPRDDHKVVIEKIRTMDRDAEKVTGKPYLIQEREEKPATWTHVDGEENFPANTESFIAPHVHEHSEEKKIVIKDALQAISQEPVPQRTRPETLQKEIVPENSKFLPTEKPAVEDVPETEIQDLSSYEKPASPKTKLFHSEKDRKAKKDFSFPNIETKELGLEKTKPIKRQDGHRFVFALVIILGITAGLGVSYFISSIEKNIVPLPEPDPVVSFFKTDARASLPFSEDRNILLQNIASGITSAPSGITHLYPTKKVDAIDGSMKEVPATTIDIFAVLSPRAPSSFIRSLQNNMMFGSVTVLRNEPFVILKSHSFDTAFAGMIDWEPFISTDLAPLFGEPVKKTFDENARTLEGSFDAHFKDVVTNNRNARILYDEQNQERIIYTFVNKSTILITANTGALQKIIDVLNR